MGGKQIGGEQDVDILRADVPFFIKNIQVMQPNQKLYFLQI